jgi:hypothetical protein
MPLRRARPVDEVIEIAGEDYDYYDLGGRDERRARRKKRQAQRKSSRSRRLKKDAARLRSESKASGARSSKRKRKKTSRSSAASSGSSSASSAASASSGFPAPASRPYEEDYEDTWEDDGYDDDYPDEDYDPEDFEDPYEDAFDDEEDYEEEEFEGEFSGRKKGVFKRRKARKESQKAERKDWTRPALVGKLRIHAQKGHRAAIRELEPGLYLVAEVSKGEMDNLQRLREAELAGSGDPEVGALGIIARLASTRAVQALRRDAPPSVVPPAVPQLPATAPAHPWYDKSKVPPGVGGAVVTQQGDSMWGIASKHLGAGLRWNQVYLLNASQLQGRKPTDPLPAGLVLWLPASPTGNWLSS